MNAAGSLVFGGALTPTGTIVGNMSFTVTNGTTSSTFGSVTFGSLVLGINATSPLSPAIGGTGNIIITGVVSNGAAFANGLTHGGTGTLTLSGAAANTYTGLTTASAGELDLGKSGSVNAIGGGGLTVGSATNTAALVKYTGASTDMMGTGTVTLNGQGQLDFNGVSDTIGNVSIVATGAGAGTTPIQNTAGGGTLTIGTLGITPLAGFTSVLNPGTGTLQLGGAVTFTSATTGQAQVTGNVDLNGGQTFNIGLGGGTGYDLELNGLVANGTLTTSTGTGRLQLSGSTANTYSGLTTVNVGTPAVEQEWCGQCHRRQPDH